MKAAAFGILGVALVAGPFLFGSPLRDLMSWRTASSWEPVQARVTRVTERRVTEDGRPRTEVDVHYTYSYQGKAREELYRVEDASPQRIPSKGDPLTIKVNPRDPSQALFNPEVDLPMRALGAFIFVGFGIYFLFMVITGRADDIPVSFSSSSSASTGRD